MTPGNFIELYQSGVRELGGNEIPGKFELYQNYPNPFNPTTKIKFDIPLISNETLQNVRMVVYDILGKEVATLVNEKLKSGSYEVSFDGSNVSSGMYFYQLKTGNYVSTKKFVLVR